MEKLLKDHQPRIPDMKNFKVYEIKKFTDLNQGLKKTLNGIKKKYEKIFVLYGDQMRQILPNNKRIKQK